MASPQPDKYTKISNELVEAFAKIRIPGEAMQVLWVIFRKTYGWNKKKDSIALSQISEMTGLKRPTVCRAITKLEALNVIKKDNGNTTSYCINKDYDTWKPLSKKITLSKKIISVDKKDNQVLSKKIHTKETITKETTKERDLDFVVSVPFPKEVDFPEVRQAFNEYCLMRQYKDNSELPIFTQERFLRDLVKFSKGNKDIAVKICNNATDGKWGKLFALTESRQASDPKCTKCKFGYMRIIKQTKTKKIRKCDKCSVTMEENVQTLQGY